MTNKKRSKEAFFTGNPRLKGILSGLFFAIFSFTMVYAFIIDTNVEQAIQYIKQTIYTVSGGKGGATNIHIGTGSDYDDIWVNGQLRATEYCDKNGANCKQSANIITANPALTQYNIPKMGAVGRDLIPSTTFEDANGNFMVGVADLNALSNPKPKFYVKGKTVIDGDTYLNGETQTNKVISPVYCDTALTPNCYSIDDFYTKTFITGNYYNKTYITTNYLTSGYISGLYYDKTHITTNYLTSGQISGLYYNKTHITTNYLTSGQISGMYYDKTHINTNYLTSGQLSGMYYDKDYITGNYVTTGDFELKFTLQEMLLDTNYYKKSIADITFVKTGYVNNISDTYIPFQSGGVLENSPLTVQSGYIQTNSVIKLGDTTETAVPGMIKFSGSNFYGYLGVGGRVQLNN